MSRVSSGATENAGVENAIRQKCRGGICGSGKFGSGWQGWKCRSGKCRSKSEGWKVQEGAVSYANVKVSQATEHKTGNQKHRPATGDNAYRQDIVTRIMLLYSREVNYNLNSIYTKYLAQLCSLCGRFFLRFGKFPPLIYESCGVTYRRNYKSFSAL